MYGTLPALPPDVIAEDPTMLAFLRLLQRYARPNLPLVLTGETGSGKEVAARLVHQLSPRSQGPWVALNCAALPDALAESELFGHERGAFTGATSARPGAFEAANGGTLFLDEVAELSLPNQAKLLRVLEEHRVRRVGADYDRAVNVRIVAATHRDLQKEAQQGKFRSDLLYRLQAGSLRVPALRERPLDIFPLAQLFLCRMQGEMGSRALADDARARLSSYPWPGNVRELRNTLARAAIATSGPTINAFHIDLDSHEPLPTSRTRGGIDARKREELIAELLRQNGNRRATARALHVSLSTIKVWIHRYEIDIPPGMVR